MNNLTYWNNNRPVGRLNNSFGNSLFDDVFGPNDSLFSSIFGSSITAANFQADIYNSKDKYLLIGYAPGVSLDTLNVQASNNQVSISGELVYPEIPEDAQPLFGRSIESGAFNAYYTLPESVIEDKVSARYKDGFLYIELPKTTIQKKIEVKVDKE